MTDKKYALVQEFLNQLSTLLVEIIAVNVRSDHYREQNRLLTEENQKLQERIKRLAKEEIDAPPRPGSGEVYIERTETDEVVLDHLNKFLASGGTVSKAAARRAVDWHRRLKEQEVTIGRYQTELRKNRPASPTSSQMSGTPA